MTLRILTVVMLLASLVCPYFAYEQYVQGNAGAKELAKLEDQLAELRAEEARLIVLPSKPVLPQGEAMGDLVLRLRAEAELLGGTIRLSVPRQSMRWVPVKHGVTSRKFRIDVTALSEGAPAIMAMATKLVLSRALRVHGAAVDEIQATVTMSLDIELFGR